MAYLKGLLNSLLAGYLCLGIACAKPYKTLLSTLVPIVSSPSEEEITRKEDHKKEEISKKGNEPIAKEEKKAYWLMDYQEAIATVNTPQEVQEYFKEHWQFSQQEVTNGYAKSININLAWTNDPPSAETFKYNHTRRRGVCLDYALAAAALLSDDGYPPLILFMKQALPAGVAPNMEKRHAVFFYRTEQGFTALGDIPKETKYPVSSLEDLVKSFRNFNTTFGEFAVVNLDDNYPDRSWISGDIDFQFPVIEDWEKVKYGR